MIPYGRQTISEDDINAVADVLRSDWLTQGPYVPVFEKALTDLTGAKHAIAVNSATSALEMACQALGLSENGLLWTVPNTFVASANCGKRCNADVDFVDIDADTHNICVNKLEEKLIDAEKKGRLPDIVVAVAFAGHSCEMEQIHILSKKYGFKIIEDASHGIGGYYKDRPVGCAKWSDITVFSFHPVKIITSAEGGAALTNDDNLAENMRLRRTHGITKDPQALIHKDEGPWHYEQHFLGANYRMTDLQAALASSQMKRLEEFIQRRRSIVKFYEAAFADCAHITLPVELPDVKSAWHLYTIKVNAGARERRKLFDYLRENGVGVQVHYIPVHLQPYYQQFGFKVGDFPIAENYAERTISLPIFPTLNEEQLKKIAENVKKGCAFAFKEGGC